MKNKSMQLGVMLLLLAMVFVPLGSANTNLNTAEKLAHQYSDQIWGENNTDIIDPW
jgi:hypothetical protein